MSAGAYRLALYAPWNGAPLGDLTDYNSITVNYGVNKVGVCTIKIDGTIKRASFWQPYTTLEIWRAVAGTAKTYLEGNRLWYLLNQTHYRDNDGAAWSELTFYDANALLAQRYILYNAETSYAKKTDYADDMLKAIVSENAGATATDATRSMITYLTIQADISAVASITRAFAWRPMFTVLQDICKQALDGGTYLAFDCVRTSNTTSEFRTFKGQRGQDRGTGSNYPLTLSWDAGNLRNPKLTDNCYQTASHVTACGQGSGTARVTSAASIANITPLTRREAVIDSRNIIASDTTSLAAEASAELQARKARPRFEGSFADTPALMYGVHLHYGDVVKVEYEGFVFDAHADNIGLALNENGEETLDIKLVDYE